MLVEEAQRNGIQLTSVSTLPADRMFSANLINRTVTVEVPVGDVSTETQVHFLNAAVMGQLKVCKALAPGSEALDGQTFDFDVTRHADADPPAGPTQRISVRASASAAQCVIVGTFPVGEQVQVTEVAPPSSVDVSGEGVVTIATRDQLDHDHEPGHGRPRALQGAGRGPDRAAHLPVPHRRRRGRPAARRRMHAAAARGGRSAHGAGALGERLRAESPTRREADSTSRRPTGW